MRMFFDVFLYAIYINWGLFVFNLIPLPPLDGSHLLFHHLRNYPAVYNRLYRYGSLILFGLLVTSAIAKINLLPIGPVVYFLTENVLAIAGYNI
jgi:Zn-dependent protease